MVFDKIDEINTFSVFFCFLRTWASSWRNEGYRNLHGNQKLLSTDTKKRLQKSKRNKLRTFANRLNLNSVQRYITCVGGQDLISFASEQKSDFGPTEKNEGINKSWEH